MKELKINADSGGFGNEPQVSERLLKARCKFWTATQWENHLTTIECPRTEALLEDGADIEKLSADKTPWEFIGTQAERPNSYALKIIRSAIKTLTPRERQVTRLRFWRDQFPVGIAAELNISEATVRIYLARATVKIKCHVLKDLPENALTVQHQRELQANMSRPQPIVGSSKHHEVPKAELSGNPPAHKIPAYPSPHVHDLPQQTLRTPAMESSWTGIQSSGVLRGEFPASQM